MFSRALSSSVLVFALAGIAYPQSAPFACQGTAVNTILRSEGVAERVGDINLSCTGGVPGSTVAFNLAVFLNVGITNHLSSAGVTDVSLTINNAISSVPPAILQASNGVSFNSVSFTIPASGPVDLRISNLRGNVSQLGPGSAQRTVEAVVSITGTPLISNSYRLAVGVIAPGLLASYNTGGIRCVGSPVPATINFTNLILEGTAFVSTRITEGFASAFEKKGGGDDNGTRIVARFTGLPARARLFVPNVIAGSDTVQPTIAGDLGGTTAGGAYAPTVAGSLLLVRVIGTDTNGAGGTLAYTPGPVGSGIVTFNGASEIPLAGGAGIAVFEVVDSNPGVQESAQFPTFLGLPEVPNDAVAIASETVSFGPISTVFTASATDPVPRFVTVTPASDCANLGDCNVNFPVLSLTSTRPLEFTATAGSSLQTIVAQINNRGGGLMRWSASVTTGTGTNWLTVYPPTGAGNGSVFVNVFPLGLAPGVYTGSLIVDVGPPGVRQTLPVRLTIITPPAPSTPVVAPPTPTVSKVGLQSLTNAARPDLTTVSPGSLAIVNGSNLKGKDVAVTFDGVSASILSGDERSISVQVPGSLRSPLTAQLQVTVDGEKSTAMPVAVSELAPAIFAEGVLNEDNSANKESNAASVGGALQIFSTGLLGVVPGPVIVKLHDRSLTPSYAGPSSMGVDQVNVLIPGDLPAMTTYLSVCGFAASNPDKPVCSEPAKVTLK